MVKKITKQEIRTAMTKQAEKRRQLTINRIAAQKIASSGPSIGEVKARIAARKKTGYRSSCQGSGSQQGKWRNSANSPASCEKETQNL